jgi:hypothetical protein
MGSVGTAVWRGEHLGRLLETAGRAGWRRKRAALTSRSLACSMAGAERSLRIVWVFLGPSDGSMWPVDLDQGQLYERYASAERHVDALGTHE